MGIVGLLAVGGLVLVPPAREYADFRRAWGFGRPAALGVTALVVPAVAVGLAVALPFSAWPLVHWGVTIAAALAAYSLAVRVVAAARSETTAQELGSE